MHPKLHEQVSLFAEVTDTELFVVVRDRGCGLEPEAATGPDRHGVADSIVGRMRRQGGTATIHTAAGAGTEVELRMPLETTV